MEFKLILEKLKHSNALISSSISKEIVTNIRHVTKTELLDILEMLQGTVDMEFQIKLISILSACLLYNTSNRDVIVKWTSLYDTLYAILSRGLPIKSTVALNFITSLLYEGSSGAGGACGARGRTLSLRARGALLTSSCLAAMTQLFTNYMLHTDTWNALCRCIAEVCLGSEVNQTYCSHLVPLCIQRCIQGNLEVFLVLQSLLHNHKRNTKLFLEADGITVFERKEYFRYECCLQLLNTVVQVIDVEELRIIKNQHKIFVNLQDVLQIQSVDSRIRQWATIILYHLESKLKENERYNKSSTITKSDNKNKDVPTNVDDTQVLFQNIMTEILSCPTKTNDPNPWKRIYKMPDKIYALNNKTLNLIKQTKAYCERTSLDEELDLSWNSNHSCKEELTFSFLMDDTLKCDQSGYINNNPTNKMNRTVSKLIMNSKHGDEHDQEAIEFNPTFVSTPIKVQPKKSTSLNKNSFVRRSFMVVGNRTGMRNNTKRKRVAKIPRDSRMQDSVKQRSMSSRLFDVINESCTTFIKSVKNVFTGNKTMYNSNKDTTIINSTNNQNKKSCCSYSFTNYMQKREAELNENKTYCEISSEMITSNTMNTCKTCDDTARLKHKFANDDQLKLTVKKLKLGINLYGCDFKKISKTMWPRETYMTPNVLYNLYRKLILK